jgi:hypothetical protein
LVLTFLPFAQEPFFFELVILFSIFDQIHHFVLGVALELNHVFETRWVVDWLRFYYHLARWLFKFLSHRIFQNLMADLGSEGATNRDFNLFGHAESAEIDEGRSVGRTLIELANLNLFYFFILNHFKPIMIVAVGVFAAFAPVKLKALEIFIFYSHGNIQRWLLVLASYGHILALELGDRKSGQSATFHHVDVLLAFGFHHGADLVECLLIKQLHLIFVGALLLMHFHVVPLVLGSFALLDVLVRHVENLVQDGRRSRGVVVFKFHFLDLSGSGQKPVYFWVIGLVLELFHKLVNYLVQHWLILNFVLFLVTQVAGAAA